MTSHYINLPKHSPSLSQPSRSYIYLKRIASAPEALNNLSGESNPFSIFQGTSIRKSY